MPNNADKQRILMAADLYGADLSAWPQHERNWASAPQRAAALKSALAEAAALEQAFDTHKTEAFALPDELHARILADAAGALGARPQGASWALRKLRGGAWLRRAFIGAGFTASAVAGAAAAQITAFDPLAPFSPPPQAEFSILETYQSEPFDNLSIEWPEDEGGGG